MKYKISTILVFTASFIIFSSCGNEGHEHTEGGHDHHAEEGGHGPERTGESVHLSQAQFATLKMQVGPLPKKNLSNTVLANGQLEVPPQNEATVTAILGANVVRIEVIEGEDVRKGQALAYLSHPNVTRLQSDYLEAYNRQQFLEKEFKRQQKLYEEEVGSGKTFQQTQADYRSAQGAVSSYESQLRQLGVNPEKIQTGQFYDRIPVVSPISGSITKVEVKTGQYVQPEKDLFEIVNVEHIHADLMVFEKDVHKVEEGQQVRFTVETLPGRELFAKIYSVGKKFEPSPKAVHVHAEIENKTGKLIPGMYIKGQILMDSTATDALPESAITREGDKFFAFLAEKEKGHEEWVFKPVQVVEGTTANGWVGVQFLDKVPENAQFALNNAYYLVAEMKKGEAGHSH